MIMPFFDKLNKAAGNLKCLSGFHKGKWTYTDATSCHQELNCERCGHKKRIKHEIFSRWEYEKEGRCVQSRSCSRCTHEAFRVKHYFDYKVPIGAMDCRSYKKTCGRCGHEEEEHSITPQHEWSSWRHSRRIGQRYRYCKNCGRREFRDYYH